MAFTVFTCAGSKLQPATQSTGGFSPKLSSGWLARARSIACVLCLLLCLGAPAFGDAVHATRIQPASDSILAGHADVYSAEVASGVVRLTAGNKRGTGVCLDTPCAHVLTNYHVTTLLGRGLKAEGIGIVKITAATGPGDEGARDVGSLQKNFTFRYDPAKDLAVLTLREPLPRPFHGLSFATYGPAENQRVVGITYDLPPAPLPGLGLVSAGRGRLRVSQGEIRALRAQTVSADSHPAVNDESLLLTFTSRLPNRRGYATGSGRGTQSNLHPAVSARRR